MPIDSETPYKIVGIVDQDHPLPPMNNHQDTVKYYEPTPVTRLDPDREFEDFVSDGDEPDQLPTQNINDYDDYDEEAQLSASNTILNYISLHKDEVRQILGLAPLSTPVEMEFPCYTEKDVEEAVAAVLDRRVKPSLSVKHAPNPSFKRDIIKKLMPIHEKLYDKEASLVTEMVMNRRDTMFKRKEWLTHREKAVNLWEQFQALQGELQVGMHRVQTKMKERFHREDKELNDRHLVEENKIMGYMMSLQQEASDTMEKAFNIRSTVYERLMLLRSKRVIPNIGFNNYGEPHGLMQLAEKDIPHLKKVWKKDFKQEIARTASGKSFLCKESITHRSGFLEKDHSEQPWADLILRPLLNMSPLELVGNVIPGQIHKLYTMYGKPVPEWLQDYERLTENRVANNPDWIYKKHKEDQARLQAEAYAAGAKPPSSSSSAADEEEKKKQDEWEAKLDHNTKKELVTMRERKLTLERAIEHDEEYIKTLQESEEKDRSDTYESVLESYQSALSSNKNELSDLNLKIDALKPGTAGLSLKPSSDEGKSKESIDGASADVAEAIAEAVQAMMINPVADGDAVGGAAAVAVGDTPPSSSVVL